MDTVEKMKVFLRGLDLTQEVLDPLFRQLDKSGITLDTWKRRTKEDWLRRLPDCGDDIYNYLHPKCIFN